MKIEVLLDNLEDGAIVQLLQSHLNEMQKYSPSESIHALEPKKLKEASMTFWAARSGAELIACGALKELSQDSGEIKSMKTNGNYLRMGGGKKILLAILDEAKRRAYTKVSLETGSHPAFYPAIAMYKKQGFVECGPFGSYKLDPYSKFFTINL